MEIPVVFEDEFLVVVNKPAGLLSTPIPPGRVTNLQDEIKQKYGSETEIAHRIDRFTSGLVAFGKNKEVSDSLIGQFRQHQPEREYLAVVRGIVREEEGTLSHYLKRIKRGFRNIPVSKKTPGSAPAHLTYKVTERFLNTTLVKVWLRTGLKNQIRVQFKAEGHPVVGDRHYAEEEQGEPLISRQALHASRLSFSHPVKNKKVECRAEIPPDMQKLIDQLRWEKKMHKMS